ncbi:CxxxxCH/CxxCH domain-containing protein [Olivibacter domesticus]
MVRYKTCSNLYCHF